MKKLKLLSLFSGIGAFEKAFDRLGVDYELEGYSEIDKYASQAYALIHDTEEWMNLGDITKIDETKLAKDIDLITYGFPCQDISLAGNQKGLTDEEGNKTRSGLVWDATRIIRETRPKVAIAENVKNLVSKKFTKEFEAILKELDEAGYNNYWKVLNAKDYGIAQNRERVFIVSIRKDIDLGLFKWPETEELTTRLLDYLENDVDEKYYLSDKMIKYISQSGTKNFKVDTKINLDIARPLTTDQNKRAGTTNYIAPDLPANFDLKDVVVKDTRNLKEQLADSIIESGVVKGGEVIKHSYATNRMTTGRRLIESDDGIMPTLSTRPDTLGVVVKGGAIRNRPNENGMNQPNLELRKDDVSNALTTFDKDNVIVSLPPLRIRKLTPKECWRLMGFDDEDHDKVERAGISNAQRYKMAGNSIVVNVVAKILKNLIEQVL